MTRIGLFTNYRDRIGHALIEKKPDIDDLIMIYTLKMGLKWQKGKVTRTDNGWTQCHWAHVLLIKKANSTKIKILPLNGQLIIHR